MHVCFCRSVRLIGMLLTAANVCLPVSAQDWPQFLGPDRNGVYNGPPLGEGWFEEGPPRVWERAVGAGFAGPVVADGRVIVFHRVEGREVVEALAADT